jgi:GNAT superfamily N-acetyltransferase
MRHGKQAKMNEIKIADDAKSIAACFGAMHELRPHIKEDTFFETIERMQKSGYHLAYIEEAGIVVAVAGFEMGEKLHRGKYLYVDDLSTVSSCRNKGYGSRLLDWIFEFAKTNGCNEVHLDSGVQRFDAHRLYLKKGFIISSHHFSMKLKS